MKKYLQLFVFVLFTCLLLAGCAANTDTQQWASISGKAMEQAGPGEDVYFTFMVDEDWIASRKPVYLYTSGEVNAGQMTIFLRGPQGTAVWEADGVSGPFNMKTQYLPEQTGEYSLGVRWDGPVSASITNLSWQAFQYSPAILVPGVGMVLVAVAFAIYSLRRGSGWKYMGLGALAWTVTVAVKFLIAIPLNPVVANVLYDPEQLWTPGNLVFYLYVGALTGITEVLLTWLLLRYTKVGQVTWPKVLGFGIGFGAFEALLLGVLSLAIALTALLMPEALASSAGTYASANNVLYGLAPVAERFSVILAHLVCNVLLFYGVMKRQWRWMWASFAFKTLVDSIAGFAQTWGVETVSKLWTIEALMLVMGLIAWWWTVQLRRRYQAEEPQPTLPVLEPQPSV